MPATKVRPFRFGTGAYHHIRSRAQHNSLARKIEDMGYAIYPLADHFKDEISPIAALMAVADATSLRIGSLCLTPTFVTRQLLHAKLLAWTCCQKEDLSWDSEPVGMNLIPTKPAFPLILLPCA